MKLSKEQQDKFMKHLDQIGVGSCPICRAKHWNVSTEVFQLLGFTTGGIQIGGPVIPFVALTCNKCGNTSLINALAAGVITQETPGKAPATNNGVPPPADQAADKTSDDEDDREGVASE